VAHPHAEAISQINKWKSSGVVQSTYEVVPPTIIVTARSKSAIVIHLSVLTRIDP
jgi:hypothetical protein